MSDLTAILAKALHDEFVGGRDEAGDDIALPIGHGDAEFLARKVAAAIEEAATITTVEQADALPLGTCVRTAKGRFSVRNTVFDTWISQADLPARVLWTPGGGE